MHPTILNGPLRFARSTPVSYTHLDVYKRQVFSQSQNECYGAGRVPPTWLQLLTDCLLYTSRCV